MLDGATQIYDNQITGGRVRATALLPETDRPISGVVADPSGRSAAFISGGSQRDVFTVPLTGGEPRLVTGLPDDPQASYTLMDWR